MSRDALAYDPKEERFYFAMSSLARGGFIVSIDSANGGDFRIEECETRGTITSIRLTTDGALLYSWEIKIDRERARAMRRQWAELRQKRRYRVSRVSADGAKTDFILDAENPLDLRWKPVVILAAKPDRLLTFRWLIGLKRFMRSEGDIYRAEGRFRPGQLADFNFRPITAASADDAPIFILTDNKDRRNTHSILRFDAKTRKARRLANLQKGGDLPNWKAQADACGPPNFYPH